MKTGSVACGAGIKADVAAHQEGCIVVLVDSILSWVELGNLGRKEKMVTDYCREPQLKHGGIEGAGDRVTP